MNKAVLTTILQNILAENKDIYEIPQRKRSNAGRKKVTFPDGWDELYVKWEKKEITAKEFICEAGLKKATFYNLLTEYKALKEINDRYVQKYKSV